jgi:hypothetical protein
MTNSSTLLADLKKLLGKLETDLHERSAEVPALRDALRAAYDNARQAERTALPFETWRDDYLTQAAVAWILACVFVRFIEDNRLIDTPLLAGSGDRLQQAKDQRTLYFQQHPTDSDREYLHHVFRVVASLPATGALFDERHNPLWAFGVSGDGATALIEFWQRIDPATGALAHDFTDPEWNTRFLGDLYQDLSEAARKKYALLQTPEFVEEFILDRTLTPAIDEFGLAEVRLIDPACGSGHFLLGAFHRLLALWQKREPAVNTRELTQRALAAVYGVDLNPFAVAIARFRLLLAALKASDIHRLVDAPAFRINLAVGDSLLHGPRPGLAATRQMFLESDADPLWHVYDTEDAPELRRILGGQYHVVVGNPPYITPKDAAQNQAYRERFESCHMKYSLAVPFMERFFDLAIHPPAGETQPAGYVGTITANSFMKREFGRKLIEEFIPRWDLTHVIDASGAYIPGHGTPTVILFARHRKPMEQTVRAVLGIRGEPQTPDDPSRGLVWSAILAQIDNPGSASEFVSVAELPRQSFHHHPWSIGGGGAAELKTAIEENAAATVGDIAESIGFASFTGADEVFTAPGSAFRRKGIPPDLIREFIYGEAVRDWTVQADLSALTPYRNDFTPLPFSANSSWGRVLWPFRTTLAGIVSFGGRTRAQSGDDWWTWYRWVAEKYRTPLSITFAAIATHNHFVLDRGGRVFKQSAPVIKLSTEATEGDHVALLGVLNSSIACFWMKQVFHCKGAQGINEGGKSEKWEQFFDFDGTKINSFPLPAARPVHLAEAIVGLARTRESARPSSILEMEPFDTNLLSGTRNNVDLLLRKLVAWQEELDWQCYKLYGLVAEDLHLDVASVPAINPGERSFEIVMARKMAAGELETTWFERHGSTPITELAANWPAHYRQLVERRIALIESDPNIALIEQPEHKRRWNVEPWEEQEQRALREWLLNRLESAAYWPAEELRSLAKLADAARDDPDFMQVAELYRGRSDFDLGTLVAELVESESVPFLPVLRYKPIGLGKRAVWEHTWELQRREDAIDARTKLPEADKNRLTFDEAAALKKKEVGDIPVPPKYMSADFISSTFWRLRGKLDVPKERFISYPNAEREADPTLVIGWAGWDHSQQAKALAAYYVRMKENEGWTPERLQPLLAGLLELLPWLKQWHNELDPAYGIGMGDYFAGFVDEEARALGFTLDDLRNWQPPARKAIRRRKSRV